jgi:hypothetical protein
MISMEAVLARQDIGAVPREIGTVVNGLGAKLDTIEKDERYNDLHKTAEAKRAITAARGQLDDMEKQAGKARNTYTDWITQTAATPRSTNADLLDEQRKDTAWQRIKGVLDTKPIALADLVDKAIRDKDAASLTALRDELPSYIRATDGPVQIGADKELAKIERGLAQVLEGPRGLAERHRLKLNDTWNDVERAFTVARKRIARWEDEMAL